MKQFAQKYNAAAIILGFLLAGAVTARAATLTSIASHRNETAHAKGEADSIPAVADMLSGSDSGVISAQNPNVRLNSRRIALSKPGASGARNSTADGTAIVIDRGFTSAGDENLYTPAPLTLVLRKLPLNQDTIYRMFTPFTELESTFAGPYAGGSIYMGDGDFFMMGSSGVGATLPPFPLVRCERVAFHPGAIRACRQVEWGARPAPVPLPATLTLLTPALGCLGISRRRRP